MKNIESARIEYILWTTLDGSLSTGFPNIGSNNGEIDPHFETPSSNDFSRF